MRKSRLRLHKPLQASTMSTSAFATPLATPQVLVYTATAGYRHDSIPTAKAVLASKQAQAGVNFTFSEDKNMFNDNVLSGFDGVMFVSNSDEGKP